jgi:hypothetical protein
MNARAVRWALVTMALGGLVMPARRAGAFTMGEQMATTGVANTVAGTAAPSAAQTIGSVKNSLSRSSSVSQSTPKLTSVRPPTGLGAGSGPHTRRTTSKHSGWGNATKGWAKSGPGGNSKSGKGWVDSSGWPKADNWTSKAKSKTAWAPSGGGAWARPGNQG